jgi:small nuclear ribonucleoprotein
MGVKFLIMKARSCEKGIITTKMQQTQNGLISRTKLGQKFIKNLNRGGFMASRCMKFVQDELGSVVGSIVLVKLRDGTTIRGVLKNYDQHMNLLLDNAEEIIDPKMSIKRGMVVIRGDTVLFVSPITS